MTRPTEVQGAGNRRSSAQPAGVRWTFGSPQAVWKHRDLLRWRYGLLGWYVLPQYALAIIVPLIFLPFIVFMGIRTAQEQGIDVVVLYIHAFCCNRRND
jgi:peptidoglycan-N-acetylglucosamine deacetylase